MTPTEQQEPPMRNHFTGEIETRHEPQEADMTGKTLKELNVKPGDVVALWMDGKITCVRYTLAGQDDDGRWFTTCREDDETLMDQSLWHLVSRAPVATHTRADLIAQRAAKVQELADLDAQIAAMPETVRIYAWRGVTSGNWYFTAQPQVNGEDHYRDFPLINGIPEGFVPVEGV